MDDMRPRLTVDPAAITANWRVLDGRAGEAVCGAVVKADAYGLGMEDVAPALAAAGVDPFFVVTPEEGLRLRRILGSGPVIYAMNGASGEALAALAAARVRPVLSTGEQCQAALSRDAATPLVCGLQVESGMNRLGLVAADIEALARSPGLAGALDVRLLMSHLGSADDEGHPANLRQAERFDAVLERLRPLFPHAARSLAATAGILLGRRYRYDLVRPGIGLFGGHPFPGARPVVALDVPILQLSRVAAGETLGYGRSWRAERDATVATLPIGYADGVLRCLGGATGAGTARIAGRVVPVVGRVNMDLLCLDVTGIPGLAPGTRVELLGPDRTVQAAAAEAGTISHEILTSLRGARVDRRVRGG